MLCYLHDLFVPHQGNRHKAKLIHNTSLLILLATAVLFQFLLKTLSKKNNSILGVATNITVERLLTKTNKERQAQGLAALTLDQSLSQAAYNKATDMFHKNYWAHNSPDGLSPWDFILNSGYRYAFAGENLAKDFQESDAVVTAWMASTTHRANIIRPEYKDIGFAIVNGQLNGEETTLVIQMFGTHETSVLTQDSAPNKEIALAQPPSQQIYGQQQSVGGSLPLSLFHKPVVDLISLSRSISLTFALLMLIVFVTDGLVLWRRHLLRASGHNLAHLIFFGSLIGAIWFTSLGAIL